MPTAPASAEMLASQTDGQSAAALFESALLRVLETDIDGPVLEALRAQQIQPAGPCSDGVLLRRVYLDTIGTLPTAEEARSFLEDPEPDRRARLIECLLERPEFADYWSLKWCDLLRVKSEFPINLWPNAVQAYHRWVRDAIAANRPYDRFVREILTSSGSNFRVPQVNFYRAIRDRKPTTMAQAVALTFMGERVEQWPEERLTGMAAFFEGVTYKMTGEWKEEIVSVDLFGAAGAGERHGVFPDGTRVELPVGQDHRKTFADWLTGADNPWFARNIVNRIWYWLLGRGIIHEPDDIREDNPPANAKLLTLLAGKLVDAEWDLKQIHRAILGSATYQRSCIPTTDRPEAAGFAHYPVRRLGAEVLIDAICQITGTTEDYSSLIPEPWTFIPGEERTIALADGSVTSPFLELFGRPARDTGLESERDNVPSAAQKLHLLNSSHIREKIESSFEARPTVAPRPRRRREGATTPAVRHTTPTGIYLAVLSRFPTQDELMAFKQYSADSEAQGTDALIDLTWALINTPEFLYRH